MTLRLIVLGTLIAFLLGLSLIVVVPSAFGTERATDRSWRQTVRAWVPTARCESSLRWHLNTGNGYYGGLQFDLRTWRAHGGSRYASYPHHATPQEQVLVASRLRYDGWPRCPNP